MDFMLLPADSELALLRQQGSGPDGVLWLHFASAHLQCQDPAEDGHAPGLVLRLDCARVQGSPGPGRLSGGRLWWQQRWHAAWAVPCELRGPLRLELDCAYGDALQVEADGLSAWFDGGPPRYRPALAC